MLERVAWVRSPQERLQIRQEKETPIIDELIQQIKGRLINGKLLPKSKFREALGYFCSLITYLKNYTQHPYARLDNNVAERAIRPLAIGRKNWLFFGSPELEILSINMATNFWSAPRIGSSNFREIGVLVKVC